MHKKTFYQVAVIILGIILTANSWLSLSTLANEQTSGYSEEAFQEEEPVAEITEKEEQEFDEKEESNDEIAEEDISGIETNPGQEEDSLSEDDNLEELSEEEEDLLDEDLDENLEDLSGEDEDIEELLDENEDLAADSLIAMSLEAIDNYTLNLSNPTTFEDLLDNEGNLILAESGTYHLSGSFDKTIVIDADDVEIFLNNVEIHSTTGEGIRIENGLNVTLNTGNTTSVKNKLSAAPSKSATQNAGFAGIRVGADSALTIEGKGKLTVIGTAGSAGIGGSSADASANGSTEDTIGTIIIDGGVIDATSGYLGSGIGGGLQSRGGTIIVNSGKITSTGNINQNTGYNGSGGAGIGGGSSHRGTIDIEINGGTINAYGGTSAAGIGGGSSRGGDIHANITITDGKINAYGGDVYSAGIGTGWAVRDNNRASSNTATIEISGGTIYAAAAPTMGNYTSGVGIGAGGADIHDSNIGFADITITGGKISAHGGMNGAGIGASDYTSANILIRDGNIEATGLFQASGIGAYKPSEMMDICIEGGTIIATGDVSSVWGATTYYGRGAGIGTSVNDMSAIYIGADADITAFARNNGAINGIIESDSALLNAYFTNEENYYVFPHDDDFQLVLSNNINSSKRTLLFPNYHHSFAVTGEAFTYRFVTSDFEDGMLCWFDAGEEVIDFNIDYTGELVRVGFTNLPDDGNENSGDEDNGDENGGDEDNGNENGGDEDTGNENGGDEDTGNENGGDEDTGNENGGDEDTGNENGGDEDNGNENGGDEDTGNENGGDEDTGNENGGDEDNGNENGGDGNNGNENGGDEDNGNENGGDENNGNENGGDGNNGNENGGDENNSNENSGSGNSNNGNSGSKNRGSSNSKNDSETTNLVTILPGEVPGADNVIEDEAVEPEITALQTVPKTGDNYSILLYIILAGISIGFIVILSKKRNNQTKN